MMIGQVIFWDLNEYVITCLGGEKRWLSMYIFALEAFGATDLFVVGKTGIQHGYPIQHVEYPDIESLLANFNQTKLVVCTGDHPAEITPISLKDYQHPTGDVLYVVGGDYTGLDYPHFAGMDVDYISIDNAVDSNNFWSPVVVGIVHRDRYLKSL